MSLSIYIPGEACAQGRPRFAVIKNKTTGKSRAVAFDPKESKNYKSLVKMAAQEAIDEQGWKYTELPLVLTICVWKSIPKSKSKKFREAAIAGYEFPAVKPDVDNVAKTIMDALSKVAYKDDSQIVDLVIKKRYTEDEPHVNVRIEVAV